jgi:hypothetical protein
VPFYCGFRYERIHSTPVICATSFGLWPDNQIVHNPSARAVLLASLLLVGCSTGDAATVEELAGGEFTDQQDILDTMHCRSVGMTFHHQWTPDFDDEAALALALEHAPALEAQRTVSSDRKIGPELWAIGDADGVAIGVVDASGAVAFCHRE